MTTQINSLADAYPKEQARLRSLIEIYREIGPAGQFGRVMIDDVLRRADKASAEQDTVAMLRMYQEMKECK